MIPFYGYPSPCVRRGSATGTIPGHGARYTFEWSRGDER